MNKLSLVAAIASVLDMAGAAAAELPSTIRVAIDARRLDV